MYRCQLCNKPSRPGDKVLKLVRKRKKVYPFRHGAHRKISIGKKKIRPNDQGGSGWEIANEYKVCKKCFEETPLRDNSLSAL